MTDHEAIASMKRRLAERVSRVGECLIWTGTKTPNGYGQIASRNKHIPAHRAAWMVANGAIQSGMHVCHRCDTPLCVNVEHLFLGTRSDNMKDMSRKGRGVWRLPTRADGRPATARLTVTQVLEIDAKLRAGSTHRSLALEYGVSRPTITTISTGRKWSDVTGRAAVAMAEMKARAS